MVPPPTPVMAPMIVSHGEKPEKFNGTKFKRWQQKMLSYLTTLNLARFLQEDAPALKEDETDRQVVAAVEAWKHADFLCRYYLLNGLDNTLYNVYYTPLILQENCGNPWTKNTRPRMQGSRSLSGKIPRLQNA